MMPAGAAVAILLFLTTAFAGPLQAQVVRGRLVDARASAPVATAFVQLVDSAGVRHAGALTDSAGGFVLRAPEPGEYRLRADRLGYESVTSPVLRLDASPLDYVFELNPRALVLPSVDARSEDPRGCERRPDGQEVVALWSAVRTALTVASWTGESGSIRFSMMNHMRELDPSMRTEVEERTPLYTTAAMPYRAVPPEQLARDGYLVTEGDVSWLLGVDADVLLSESFLDSHCFRIVGSDDSDRVGLGFTPLRSDDRTDVSGVLWVDRRTAELQYLEFEYEGLPDHMRRFGANGAVRFERLSTGAWIITRWWIRSPLVTRRGMGSLRLIGYREDGGTITSADAIDTGMRAGSGVIEGTVYDSIAGRPFQKALVFLAGTPFSAVSNDEGRYRMERLPPGMFEIGFTHPLLDELGVPQRLDTVSIGIATTLERSFAGPSMRGILRAVCPGEQELSTGGLLYGIVRHEETGEPLPGVAVRASWDDQPRSIRTRDGQEIDRWAVRTDSDGRYAICRVPTNREIEIRVDTRDVRHRDVEVQLAEGPILRQDF